MSVDSLSAAEMAASLDTQKAAQLREGTPSAEVRIDRLDRAIDLLVSHADALAEAMKADFGHRSIDQSLLTDISSSLGPLKHCKTHLKTWMRPQRRKVDFPLGLLGAKAELHFQPKGVVGLISPWNFPVNMTFAPLANILAAGNRVMIKPSEFTEATSELMQTLFAQYFDQEEIVVVTGGPETGAAFTALPLDHIIFTGSTSIARHVMRAAADNLVPVTLELGGKSPVVLGRSANMDKAAKRIMAGKTLNAGQICLAPDYVFVPEEALQEFVGSAKNAVETLFPTGLKDNDDYTSIVNQRHFDRLQGYLAEAREKGAEIVSLDPAGDDFSQQPHHKMPPQLVLNPSDDLQLMQDEIFGPILPIKPYKDTAETVDYINRAPRPLAVYYFGENARERDQVIHNTVSGGVTVNDVIFHIAQEDLPFGGVGPSGMGVYHGREGFVEFSNQKGIYTQTGSELLAMIRPPYGETFRKQVLGRIKR